MLIIAIPKSASSSLESTLAAILGLPVRTRLTRRALRLMASPAAAGFPVLGSAHVDFSELDGAQAAAIAAAPAILKFHLPPTANNLQRLAAVPKVVLLREPSGIVDAYWRGFASGTYVLRHPAIFQARNADDWRQRAAAAGFPAELKAFCDGWRGAAGNQLVISYEELVQAPEATLRRVLSYLGKDAAAVPELAREKYTRGAASLLHGFLRRSRTRLQLIGDRLRGGRR